MQDSRLEDYITGLLLRYFRKGRQAHIQDPRVDRLADAEFLRLHWAVSLEVEELCEYVRQNRHEVQASLDYREGEDDLVIRGRLDARRTLVRRRVTGRPTYVVFREPVKSYNTGPNHVLVWCILQAHRLVERLQAMAPADSSYGERTRAVAAAIQGARHVASVSQAVAETNPTVRPSALAQTQAAKSRKQMYRLAFSAYRRLLDIEAGEEDAIRRLLKQTLISPQDTWRAFELAVVLAIGEALAQRVGVRFNIRHIKPGSSSPVIECGQFAIYWQSKTELYTDPQLEPSEIRTAAILASYGMKLGEDRPDAVVVDRSLNRVVALVEAKYFDRDEDGWRDPFRDAVSQLVRYARGYADNVDPEQLLSRSLIALWQYPREDAEAVAGVPGCIDFERMTGAKLSNWADRIGQ